MVNDNKAKLIAKYAIMFATIFVAMMLDKAISSVTAILGIGFSMAGCVLLVTLSFCFFENKWSMAVLSGLFFGVASFIKEFLLPSPSLAVLPPYYWPFVTIPSRVLMTTVAFAVYRLTLVLLAKQQIKRRQIISIVVGALFGLVVNTIGFLSSVQIAYRVFVDIHGQVDGLNFSNVLVIVYGILLTNIVPEYLISLIGVAPVVLGFRRGLKIGIAGSQIENRDNNTQDKQGE